MAVYHNRLIDGEGLIEKQGGRKGGGGGGERDEGERGEGTRGERGGGRRVEVGVRSSCQVWDRIQMR